MSINPENILISKINDCVRLADERCMPTFFGFLNDKEQFIAINTLKHLKCTNYILYGGAENTTRKMLGVFPANQQPNTKCFPIAFISFSYNNSYSLNHRDFLGALMGIGFKRDAIGDIILTNGNAAVVVKKELKKYVLTQVNKVGSVGVKVTEIPSLTINSEQRFLFINCTVASLRIDNICSAITKLSREKACKLINTAMVYVNYAEVTSVSANVKQNDVVTIRGYGKYIISDICGTTKKGRQKLIIKQYS